MMLLVAVRGLMRNRTTYGKLTRAKEGLSVTIKCNVCGGLKSSLILRVLLHAAVVT